jgi:hypothetical protein
MSEFTYRRGSDRILLSVPWGFRSGRVAPDAIRFPSLSGGVEFVLEATRWR